MELYKVWVHVHVTD